jgi:hypothetical protein
MKRSAPRPSRKAGSDGVPIPTPFGLENSAVLDPLLQPNAARSRQELDQRGETMTACRQCGALVPPTIGRLGGMPKAFCGKACRDTWTKIDQKAKRAAQREIGEAPVDKPAWSPAREIANRRAEIDRTPSLRAALERVKNPQRMPLVKRLRRLEADGLRYRKESNAQA